MKKSNIVSFIAGAMIFGSVGVFAGQYTATENPFPVQLNGSNVSMEGYNINGSTYFKLRDIADTVGGFNVDFWDNTIELSKDGYEYDHTQVQQQNVDYSKYIGTWADESGVMGLTINSIDSSGMNVEIYRLRGKGITYTIDSMTFVDEYTIVAQGASGFLPYGNGLTPTTYTFKFAGDNIVLDTNDGSEATVFYKQ